MKKMILLITVFAVACRQPVKQTDVNELLEADRAFSAMCVEKGMGEAFVAFAADDVIKLNPHQHTIMNKQELIENFKKDPDGAALKFSWEPVKADVSGDIGYTFGKCKIVSPPDSDNHSKTTYFNYVTVWKKQKDNSWKYQTDAGNVVPPPAGGNQ
jgi:ketosteroid isomerase-like protein